MIYFLQAAAAAVLNLLIQMIPLSWGKAVARFAGNVFYLFSGKRYDIAMRNINRAFKHSLTLKQKKKIARASFQNMALSIVELFTVEKIRKKTDQYFQIQGLENYKKAIQGNRGIVLIVSHLGSWEYLAFLFYLTKTRCSVIVKDVKNPYINKRVNEARRKMSLVPVQKKKSIRKVLKELKQNHTVAVLIDQWDGPAGIWQEFFGEFTSVTSIPARLALQTGCALLPAFCLRGQGDCFDVDVQAPIFPDPEKGDTENSITQRLNHILEEKIRQYPEQWIWTHRRWKSKPRVIREPEV